MGLAELMLVVVVLGVTCAGAIVPAVLIGLVIQSVQRKGKLGINVQATDCPGCGLKLPAIRRPQNVRQAMWGGWTCAGCGLELDKWGRVIGA